MDGRERRSSLRHLAYRIKTVLHRHISVRIILRQGERKTRRVLRGAPKIARSASKMARSSGDAASDTRD